MTPKVFFRADASIELGSGHVVRCLTLAQELRNHGVDSAFISRDLPGNLFALIEQSGFQLLELPTPDALGLSTYTEWLSSNWELDALQTENLIQSREAGPGTLVVDHYALDRRWEQALCPYTECLVAIDDLANRPHACDILLDQNLYPEPATRYVGKVPENCLMLLGPIYALLRPQFVAARQRRLPRTGPIRRVLVFFGGADPTDETSTTLLALEDLNHTDVEIDVVVGASNPNRDRIKDLCHALPRVSFHLQVKDMASLMASADLAIGAGGTSTWERLCLHLPSLVVTIASNQEETNAYLARIGQIEYLGKAGEDYRRALQEAVEIAITSGAQSLRAAMAHLDLVDGQGVGRVAQAIIERTLR